MKIARGFIIFYILAIAFTAVPSIALAADHILFGARYTYPIGNTTCNAAKYNSTVKDYDTVDPASGKTIRQLVQEQLAQMHNNGVDFIKLGVQAPSVDNEKIPEPIRTNYIHALQDVKNSGLSLITGGGPDANVLNSDPKKLTYDPSTFNLKWVLFQDAHSLAEQYGPPNTLYDIGGEIAPSDYQNSTIQTNMINFATKMWQHYVSAYDNKTTVMSGIADQFDDQGNKQFWGGRLENLIEMYKNSGKGYPSSWDFSLYPYPCRIAFDKKHPCTVHNNIQKSTLFMLRYIDNTLNQNGLSQPIGITETFYNDKDVAAGISDFRATSSRKILFISEWPLTVGDRLNYFEGICEWPPYAVDAYKVLNVTQKPGDFNSDGKVDIFDYNILVEKWGNPYTLSDYNQLMTNFGK